jgi:hypothetical protein
MLPHVCRQDRGEMRSGDETDLFLTGYNKECIDKIGGLKQLGNPPLQQ